MGLDTDDIVALSIDIPLIVIGILLIIGLFFMKSPKIRKELVRMLLKRENANTPLLEIVYGKNNYDQYLSDLKREAIEHYKLENPLSSTMPYDKVYPSDELLVTAYLDDFIAPSALWHAIDDKISGKAVH